MNLAEFCGVDHDRLRDAASDPILHEELVLLPKSRVVYIGGRRFWVWLLMTRGIAIMIQSESGGGRDD